MASSRTAPLSGFPEWLPHERRIEQHFLDTLRSVFELHGYLGIETRAVEPLDTLLQKGETSKEVYLLRRLQAEAAADSKSETDPAKQLGLHFDLTVPFARYVAEKAGHLQFPFRRYQIQKAWRGERPQEGRYREFLQADIDIVGKDSLPFSAEVETLIVAAEALWRLPIPPVIMRVNNRKVVEGYYRGLGLQDPATVLRVVDKLDKIGPDKVRQALADEAGATPSQADACLALATISGVDDSVMAQVRALGVTHPLLDEGLEELGQLLSAALEHTRVDIRADLSIARGLDYYTGTVYETTMVGFESYGSVCSGGRYDNLVTIGKESYPGVGISIGVTRLLGLLLPRGAVELTPTTATKVLVALVDETSWSESFGIATALRRRGIATEVSSEPSKFGKQIRFAERRGIPYVWFPPTAEEPGRVRDIRTGEQTDADPGTWRLPAADAGFSVRGSSVGRSDGQAPRVRKADWTVSVPGHDEVPSTDG